MRFVYTGGDYTQFMGRTFAFQKPTEVTDGATVAALLKRSDFKKVDDDEQAKKQAPAAPAVLAGKIEYTDGFAILHPKRPVLTVRKNK